MCEAASISIGLTALSTAMGVFSQYEQGRQQQSAMMAQAEAEAKQLEYDKALKRQMAQDELNKGEAERTRQQRAAMRLHGEAVAGMGASGLTLDSGSNLSLLGESMEEAQYDSNIITENANRAAWQHQVGITGLENQQSMLSARASNASSGPDWLGMGGTLLGGIGKGLNQWNAYRNTAGGTGGSNFIQGAINTGKNALDTKFLQTALGTGKKVLNGNK